MKLTLGFSPCPNDTFIFDALVNKKLIPAIFLLMLSWKMYKPLTIGQ